MYFTNSEMPATPNHALQRTAELRVVRRHYCLTHWNQTTMKHFTLTIALLVTLGISALTATEPKIEPIKASGDEVLFLLHAQAWKWRYRSPMPYSLLTLRVLQFTRKPTGDFERHEIINGWSSHTLRETDELLIVCGDKEVRAAFFDTYGMNEIQMWPIPDVSLAGYLRVGTNDAPCVIGSEYLLMARYKEGKDTQRKEDMTGYVAVEFDTK